MKVSLARALKEKNRLAGKLRKALNLVQEENRKIAGSPRSIDVAQQLATAEQLSAQLAQVKSIIAAANGPIVGTIVELEETKSLISALEAVDTKDEIEVSGYGANQMEKRYDVVLQAPVVLEKIAKLQARADALQDQLDEFNATTRVTLPDLNP